jgi:hypothetical protein
MDCLRPPEACRVDARDSAGSLIRRPDLLPDDPDTARICADRLLIDDALGDWVDLRHSPVGAVRDPD